MNKEKTSDVHKSGDLKKKPRPKPSEKSENYYDDNIPRAAVGRLFDDYIKEEGHLEQGDFDDSYDDYDDYEFFYTYDENAPDPNEAREYMHDKDYMAYIKSMSRATRRQERILEQPDPISDTMRNNFELREFSTGRIQKQDNENDDYESYVENNEDSKAEKTRTRTPSKNNSKSAIFVSGLVVVVIFSFFFVKLTSLNSQLVKANDRIVDLEEELSNYMNDSKENKQLNQKIAELESELEKFIGTDDDYSEANPTNPSHGDDPSKNSTPSENNNQLSQKYVVQDNETLWTIARKFYNDGSKFSDIQQANNLTENAILKPGMELIIP